MIDATKLQDENTAAVKDAKDTTADEKKKKAVLEIYEEKGAAAIHNIDHQKVWHVNSLKAAKTEAEVATLKDADTKSHTAAVTA